MEGLSEELSCAPDSLVDLRTGAYDCDCEQPNPTVADIVGGAWEWLDDFRGWCAGDKGLFSENWWFIYGDELCEINQCVGCSRRRVDGVEVDATIQHERAVKF